MLGGIAKVLITGGCGAIGSEVINRLKSIHKDVMFINLDACTYAGNPSHIEAPLDNYKLIKGNICDADLVAHVLHTERPEVIVHLAAETHVDNSFGNSFAFTKTNVFGTHVLLECTRQYMQEERCFKMFVHMSTDEVYGSVGEDEPAKTEQSLFAPSNPYAATKAAAEMICQSYIRSFNVPIIIVRCNNAISKYQNAEKLIPRTIDCFLQGVKVPVHGMGQSKRTFVHAYDIADAFQVIITKGEAGAIYNIGSQDEKTVLETIAFIAKEMKQEYHDFIEFVPDRVFQDYRYHIDYQELLRLGWTPKMSFEDSVRDVIQHRAKQHSTPCLETLS